MNDRPFLDGDCQALPKRGLTEDACRKFGYMVGQLHGKVCQIANYRDDTGAIVAQKVRFPDKSFAMLGEGKHAPLFGQHLWKADGRRVVVTEGEIDALSVAQVFGLSWPVVSLPNGASGAKASIQRALSWLSGFDQVVLCFDMDDAGRKAAAECAPLFEPGKCAIAELPLKDANDMLVAGETKALVSAIWQARVYRPDGIVAMADIRDKVLAPIPVTSPWFLPTLAKATYGRRAGELVILGAGTGIGKTDLITQSIAHDVMVLGETVGVLFLEQGVGETGKRIAGKMVGKRFHVPDESWTQEELESAWAALEATSRLHLYDAFGVMDWPTIKSRIHYMATALGCTKIYLDHLTALAAAEEEERKGLDRIMAEMAGLAQATKTHITAVSHLATPEGKSHEEGGRVMLKHLRGSRAVAMWAHFALGLERDQQADDPAQREKTTLRVLKDRFTGNATGLTIGLSYDRDTGLLSEAAPFDPETSEVDRDF